MGVLRWLEAKCFLGEVVRDYGVIDETKVGIARTRVSVLLCRRGGEQALVIKESALAWLGFSVRYTKFPRASLLELKRALDDALMRVT